MVTNRRDNVIEHKNNLRLQKDEMMTPMLADVVLLNEIEIDARLPTFVRSHYTQKMSKTEKLIDIKNDIINNIPTFLKDLEKILAS